MTRALNKGQSDNPPARADVMLVYEDMGTGFRAFRCFQYLDEMLDSRRINTDLHWTLWKLGLFSTQEFYDQAVLAAVRAEVIVMSLHGDRGLGSAIESWLTAWVNQRGDKECALGVLFDDDKREMDSVRDTLLRLQQATRQGAVELFSGFMPSRVVEDARAKQSPPGITPSSLAPHNVLEDIDPYCHWGLNE
ncbi:MAG: hypothetical protein ABSE16_11440 [Verrucomicrobiota bacterium]